ncbi:MAG: PEGA domain-containing protein [Planctomycetes bacterium]|nr:PEGA domain-containing protein [Planctomycetota bacterium]
MPAISHRENRPQSPAAPRRRAPSILRPTLAAALALALFACGGTRILRVDSVPQGALVRLDEDVIGRTPLEYNFTHYGHRRLSLYLHGYRTYSEKLRLEAPWHATFPIDIFTEVLLPLQLGYEKSVQITLEPDDGKVVYETLESFVERAESLRDALEIPPAPAEPDADGEPGSNPSDSTNPAP